MHRVIGECAAVAGRAHVGREMDGNAAPYEHGRERFRGKQMAASPAGRDEHPRARLRHQAGLPAGTRPPSANRALGRSRVSAISIPMP